MSWTAVIGFSLHFALCMVVVRQIKLQFKLNPVVYSHSMLIQFHVQEMQKLISTIFKEIWFEAESQLIEQYFIKFGDLVREAHRVIRACK